MYRYQYIVSVIIGTAGFKRCCVGKQIDPDKVFPIPIGISGTRMRGVAY